MNIAIVGPGSIGSTFAFQLSRAGHDVTVIARGARLERLRADEAIVKTNGERAKVSVAGSLDPSTPFDLVLVTVLVSQVDAVLPALAASSTKTVMFMFNTFEPLARLRDAVGAARFAFGFPAILATLDEGKLTSEIVSSGMVTTVTNLSWAKVFRDAGIATATHDDMESWLRTHAALVAPMMIASARAYEREGGVTWAEAGELARAMREGFDLVRRLGNQITPSPMPALSRLPIVMVAMLVWATCRVPSVRKTGAAGYGEPRTLIDAMIAASSDPLPRLRAIRP